MLFINGDTTQDTFTHWCLGCCRDDADSRAKLVKLLVPWMGRGYSVPLLSRFKHYGAASSYIKVGCALGRLLPRILQGMQGQSSEVGPELTNMIDVLLADTCLSSNSRSFSEEDLQALVGGMMEADINYSVQNAVRRNMMIKAITRPEFCHEAIVMDCLLQPIEFAVNYLFGRTVVLHRLSNVGVIDPEYEALLQKSRAKFLHISTGGLGKDLMGGYMSILQKDMSESIELGLDIGSNRELLRLTFELVIVGITDSWRRLVHELSAPPFSLFTLVSLPVRHFVDEWVTIGQKFTTCSSCVDDSLTRVLLSEFPHAELAASPLIEQAKIVSQIQQVLMDLAAFTPLSSDLVEIKHGVVQWAVSRRARQQVKNPTTARETTFLQACIKQFLYVKEMVSDMTMPSKLVSSSIMKMSGARSTNQFSSASAPKKRQRISQETMEEKTARTEKASTRKLRGLSGWNIFQRQHLQGLLVNPDTYKEKVREASAAWKRLPQSEKDAYQIEAANENELRSQLAQQPLVPKSAGADSEAAQYEAQRQLEQAVGRSGSKKLSARRLALNLEAQKSHGMWKAGTQYSDSNLVVHKKGRV